MKTRVEVMKDLGRVLRHNIVLEKLPPPGYDASGDPTPTDWVPVCEMRAERKSLYGRDYFAAVAVGEQETVEFIVRKSPALAGINTDNHRLKHGSDIYDIRQIDYLEDGGLWLKIRALRHG